MGALAPIARAQLIWTGGGADNNWGTAANWNNSTLPGNPSASVLRFAGSTRLTPNLSANWTVNGIRFDSGAGAFTIGSTGAFTLTIGTLSGIINASANNQTISSAIALSGVSTFSANASGGSILVSGNISGASGGVSKNGGGLVTLSGTNSFQGPSTLNAGTLALNNVRALGPTTSAGSLTINGGALDNTSGGALTLTSNNAQTWNGNFGFVGTNSLNVGTGAVTLGATTPVTPTIRVDNNTLTVGGAIDDSLGTAGLTKAGAGTLALTNAGSTYGGVTTVNAGTLQVSTLASAGAASSIGNSSSIAANLVLDGGTLQYTGGSVTSDRLFSVGANGGTLDAGAGGGTLTLNNAGTIGGNGSTAIRDLTLAGTSNGVLASILSDNTGATSLTKTGTGTWSLTAANSYTGNTTISAGTLSIGTGGTAGSLSATTNIIDNSALTFNKSNSLTVANTISGTGNVTQAGAGTTILTGINTYAGGTTISAGTLQVGNAGTSGTAGTGNIVDNAALVFNRTDAVTVSNTISGSGTVTQGGTGTLTLSGTNTYTGKTSINSGTLAVSSLANTSANSNLGAPTTVANGTIAIGSGTTGATLLYTGSGSTSNRVIDLAGTTGGATLDSSGTGAVTLSGGVTATGAGSKTLTLTGSNTGLNTLSGVIVNNSNTNKTSIDKSGAGEWLLSGTNTYNGTTTLNSGTLVLGNARALGSNTGPGNFIINGGTLDSNVANLALTSNNAQNWNGDFIFAGTQNLNLGTGAVTLGATRTVTVTANTLTIGGAIDDGASTFGLTKAGAGTLALTGASTYGGTTTINGGTISQTGTLTSALTFGGTGTYAYSPAGGTVDSLNALTFSAGDGTIISTRTGGNMGLTFSSLATRGTGATGLFSFAAGTIGTNNKITLTGVTANAFINQGLFVNTGAATNATYAFNDSTGFVRGIKYGTDTNASTFGAGTSVGSGTLNKYVQTTGAISAQATATINTLEISGASNFTLSAGSTLTLTNGGLLKVGNNAATISGGTGIKAGSGAELVVYTDRASDALTISTPILANGTNALTKGGLGTLTLNAANTYSGTTYLNAGTLVFANAGALGGSGALTINGGTIDVSGAQTLTSTNSQSWNGDFTFGGSNTLTMGAGAVTLGGNRTITTTASTLTVPGAIGGGPLSLTKAGAAGTLVLNGANTYTGGTILTAGTLTVGSAGSLSASGAVTLNGGTLNLNNTGGQTVSALNGAAGTAINLATGVALIVSDTGTDAFAGVIAGASTTSNLTKTNNGTLALTGANTYQGVTTINGGTLSVSTLANGGVASSIGQSTNAAANLVLSGGTLAYTGGTVTTDRGFTLNGGSGTVSVPDGVTLTFAGTLTGTGALTKTGTDVQSSQSFSTLVLTGSNTGYSGATTINTGGLQINNENALGTGTITVGVNVNSEAALVFNNASSFANPVANPTITLNGFGRNNDGAMRNEGAGSVIVNSNVVLASDASIESANASSTLTLAGTISGANDLKLGGVGALTASGAISTSTLEKTGTDTVTLTGSNSYGVTTISSGTLKIGNGGTTGTLGSGAVTNNGTLDFDRSNAMAVTNAISGPGAVIQDGTGTTTLSGTNSYIGATTVNAGSLIAASNTALGGAAGNITVNSGGSLGIAAGTTITKTGNLTLNGTGASGTTGALMVSGATGTTGQFTGNITLAGAATLGAANNLLIVGDGSSTTTGFFNTINLGSNTLTLNASVAVDGSTPVPTYLPTSHVMDQSQMVINAAIYGSGGIEKTGAGTVTLVPRIGGGSTFTGDTNVRAGKLILDSAGSTPAINSNNVYVGNSGSTALNSTADSAILQLGELAGPAANSNMLGTYNNATDASATNLTVYADGVFNMNNASNGFASVSLTGGHINGNGTTPLLTITGGISTGASDRTAVIEGGRIGLASFGNSNFTIAAGSSSLVGGDGRSVDLRIDDIVQQGLLYTGYTDTVTSLTKLGGGKLVLTGVNTYHGVTDISAGIINIQNAAALGATGSTVSDTTHNGTIVETGAQLQLESATAMTIGFEGLTLNGTGLSNDGALRNVAGNNIWNGFISLNGATNRINADTGTTLKITNTSGVGSTIIDGTAAGKNLVVGGGGDVEINGGVGSSVGSITKGTVATDTGTLTLAGVNGYTGATTVAYGAVKITNSDGLQGTGATVASGAALQFAQTAGGADISVLTGVAATINGTGISNHGAIENLNGSNKYDGAITLGSAAKISADGTSVTSSSLTLNGTIDATHTHNALTLSTGDNTATASTQIVVNNAITNGSVTAGLATPGGNTGGVQYNIITAVGGTGGTLTKDGGGTLLIQGTHTSTLDGITLTLGNLTVGDGTTTTLVESGPLSSANKNNVLTINSHSTVELFNKTGTTMTFNGQLAGAGTLQIDGVATAVGSAANSHFVFDSTLATGTNGIGVGVNATSLTLLITGGEIDFRGNSTSSLTDFGFGTVHIAGNTILDFDANARTSLTSANLIIDAGVSVIVNNWTGEVDFWYATSTFPGVTHNAEGTGAAGRITFANSGFTAANTAWIQGPYPGYTNTEIRPIPEPATYGVLFFSGCLALLGWRRYSRRSSTRQE